MTRYCELGDGGSAIRGLSFWSLSLTGQREEEGSSEEGVSEEVFVLGYVWFDLSCSIGIEYIVE